MMMSMSLNRLASLPMTALHQFPKIPTAMASKTRRFHTTAQTLQHVIHYIKPFSRRSSSINIQRFFPARQHGHISEMLPPSVYVSRCMQPMRQDQGNGCANRTISNISLRQYYQHFGCFKKVSVDTVVQSAMSNISIFQKHSQSLLTLRSSRSESSVVCSVPARKSFGINDVRWICTGEHSRAKLRSFTSPKSTLEETPGVRNVGRSSRNNDVNNSNLSIANTGNKLHERTRLILKGRVSKLKSSFSHHKMQLRVHLRAQKMKGALAVRKFQREFGEKVSKSKKENIKTIPNLLTTLRMASAPVLAYLVVHDYFGMACSLFVLAGVTDLLDGYIARNFKNQRTALGTALDPLADKLLVSFLTVSLTSAGLIPVPMTVLILSRDAGLIAGSFYIRYISLAPPRTLARYFDVSHVTAKLYPSNISKVNTLLQLSYVASTLASPVFDIVGHPWLQALMYVTATTTFLSGADYVLTWRRRLKIIKNK